MSSPTDGLSSRYVGRLTFDFGSGVIGKVAQEHRPFNLDQVPETLERGFLAQTGLPPHAGCLSVPILHKSRVHGDLLVRQRRPRRFDDADEASLSTPASTLGGAIAYAESTGAPCTICRPTQALCLEGRAGAPGIAVGIGAWAFSAAELQTVPDRPSGNPSREEGRFLQALRQVRQQAQELAATLQARIPEADRAMFDAFAMMLDSEEIKEAVIEQIQAGQWAPAAVRTTFESHAAYFDGLDDPYLQQRASDVRALGARILAHLLGGHRQATSGSGPTILIGKQLSAMDVGDAAVRQLVGIVSADGSPLSHAAILARSLGIPAVMAVSEVSLSHLDGQPLIVDGHTGRVRVRPDQATKQAVGIEVARQRASGAALEPIRHLPAQTIDGKRISLLTNAGLMILAEASRHAGSDGIGLFRSELPFMMFDRFPSELEQRDLYGQALAAVAPLPMVLRTLDAGGDKPLPYLSEDEANPALGWRGIRFMLDHPDIFLTQIRAALRANVGLGNLRLLFPMVTALDEVTQARRLVEQAVRQLQEEGLHVSIPPIGAMVEVPAAVYLTESLARQLDFLSVGTNDLSQYLLATDRNNPRVSGRLDTLHPALLQALHLIATAAHRVGKPVTVCGELASDPAIAMLLVGMGYDGLSINPTALLEVKAAIRGTSFRHMRSLAEQGLLMDDPATIRKCLEEVQSCTAASSPRTRESTPDGQSGPSNHETQNRPE